MVIKLNFNTILVALGGLGVFAPDVAFIAHWLNHIGIPWLTYAARFLGFVAAFFAAAPLAVPKLRAFLALFKLATPAGEMVPHPEVKVAPTALGTTPPTDNKQAGLVLLDGLLIILSIGCSILIWNHQWNELWTSYAAKSLSLTATILILMSLGAPTLRSLWALGVRLVRGKKTSQVSSKAATADSKTTATTTSKRTEFVMPGRLLVFLCILLLALFISLWWGTKIAHADDGTTSPAVTAPSVVLVAPAAVPLPTSAVWVAPAAPSLPVVPSTPTPAPTPASTSNPPTAPTTASPHPPAAPAPIAHDTPVRKIYKSKYGGCRGNFCLAPTFSMQALQYVPATGKMKGGVSFAGGYGVVWHTIIDVGLAVSGGVQFSSDKPFEAQGLAMVSIANYFAFGPGFEMLGQSSGPAIFHLTICFAANWIPGLG